MKIETLCSVAAILLFAVVTGAHFFRRMWTINRQLKEAERLQNELAHDVDTAEQRLLRFVREV